MKHIVSFSGGKDSTAMLLLMLEKNMQKILIAILIILNLIMCFKGLRLETENR